MKLCMRIVDYLSLGVIDYDDLRTFVFSYCVEPEIIIHSTE